MAGLDRTKLLKLPNYQLSIQITAKQFRDLHPALSGADILTSCFLLEYFNQLVKTGSITQHQPGLTDRPVLPRR